MDTYFLRPKEDNMQVNSALGYQPEPEEFMAPSDAAAKLNKIIKGHGNEGVVASIALSVDGRLNLAATNAFDLESNTRRRMDIMRETHFDVYVDSGSRMIRIDLPLNILNYVSEKHAFSADNKTSEEYFKYENLRNVMHDYLIELTRRLIEGGMNPNMAFVAYPDLNKVLFEDFGETHPDTLGRLARIKEYVESSEGEFTPIDIAKHKELYTGINPKLLEDLNRAMEDLRKLKHNL